MTTTQPALDGTISPDAAHEFWSEVNKSEACWLWTGMTFAGYGYLKVNGRAAWAHRTAWCIANSSNIPDGMVVRHKCDTSVCVRPDHLELGTYSQNNRDRYRRGRHKRAAPHGEAHCNALLTVQIVDEMRRSARRGEAITAIASRLGHPYNTAYNAIRGISWESASEPPVSGTYKKRKAPHWNRLDRKHPELYQKAIELRDQGLPITRIAEQLGITKSAASRWCRTEVEENSDV